MQTSALCRSRREFSNAHFLTNFRLDTAENGPSKVCPVEPRSQLARVVVQAYIERPLLLGGFKFDFRVHSQSWPHSWRGCKKGCNCCRFRSDNIVFLEEIFKDNFSASLWCDARPRLGGKKKGPKNEFFRWQARRLKGDSPPPRVLPTLP